LLLIYNIYTDVLYRYYIIITLINIALHAHYKYDAARNECLVFIVMLYFRVVTCSQELILLKEFEKIETVFAHNVNVLNAEKQELEDKVSAWCTGRKKYVICVKNKDIIIEYYRILSTTCDKQNIFVRKFKFFVYNLN